MQGSNGIEALLTVFGGMDLDVEILFEILEALLEQRADVYLVVDD